MAFSLSTYWNSWSQQHPSTLPYKHWYQGHISWPSSTDQVFRDFFPRRHLTHSKRNSTTKSQYGWAGPSSVPRNHHNPNTSNLTQTAYKTWYIGIFTTQTNPSSISSPTSFHHRHSRHSTSNHCPDRLPYGYFLQNHPRHNRRNIQIHCVQEVWKLVPVVNIHQPHRCRVKFPWWDTTIIQ